MPYTKQNTRIPQFSISTVFLDNTGTALAVNAVAHVESLLINAADISDVVRPRQKTISFDLLDPLLTASITAAGKTVSYPQLAALLRQACLDRATAQGVS